MILDNQTMYTSGQAPTAIGDTASTNSYDHGLGSSGAGAGDLWLVVKTSTAFTSGGAGTLQAVLQDSADNSSFADVQTLTPVLALAALTANKVLAVTRYPGVLRRYTRVAWRIAAFAMTGGTVSAFPVLDTDIQQYLGSGFSV